MLSSWNFKKASSKKRVELTKCQFWLKNASRSARATKKREKCYYYKTKDLPKRWKSCRALWANWLTCLMKIKNKRNLKLLKIKNKMDKKKRKKMKRKPQKMKKLNKKIKKKMNNNLMNRTNNKLCNNWSNWWVHSNNWKTSKENWLKNKKNSNKILKIRIIKIDYI